MTKQEWIDLEIKLRDIYSEFLFHYHDSKHGKNKKIRDNAENKVRNAINSTLHVVNKDSAVFKLLVNNRDDHSSTIYLDEFKRPNYFNNDMPDFLNRIKNKINEQN